MIYYICGYVEYNKIFTYPHIINSIIKNLLKGGTFYITDFLYRRKKQDGKTPERQQTEKRREKKTAN